MRTAVPSRQYHTRLVCRFMRIAVPSRQCHTRPVDRFMRIAVPSRQCHTRPVDRFMRIAVPSRQCHTRPVDRFMTTLIHRGNITTRQGNPVQTAAVIWCRVAIDIFFFFCSINLLPLPGGFTMRGIIVYTNNPRNAFSL